MLTVCCSGVQLCQLIRDQVFVSPDERSCSCRRRVPDSVAIASASGADVVELTGAAAREGMRDADSLDSMAAHVLGTIGDMPVGTCRLRVLEESADASGIPRAWALDKVAVLQRYQRQGLATAMIEQTVANAAGLPVFGACTMVVADAPVEQGAFWQKLHFVPCASALSICFSVPVPTALIAQCSMDTVHLTCLVSCAAEEMGGGTGRFLRRLA